jgi:hypothetical protein
MRSLLASISLLTACAHAAPASCPQRVSSPSGVAAPPAPGLGFASAASLSEAEPLALYDLHWMLLTGDSGALVELPLGLHAFTLGKWECALGSERAQDALTNGVARVSRSRKLVCTHATGLTMQTELSCNYAMPGPVQEGAPRKSRREVRVELADAPLVSLACEPVKVERLALVEGERKPLADACVEGASVVPCPN